MFDVYLWTKEWQPFFFLFPQLSFCNLRWRTLCTSTKAEGLVCAPWFLFICQCAYEHFLVHVSGAEQYIQGCILCIRCASWSIKLPFMVFSLWFWISSFFHSARVWWSILKISQTMLASLLQLFFQEKACYCNSSMKCGGTLIKIVGPINLLCWASFWELTDMGRSGKQLNNRIKW